MLNKYQLFFTLIIKRTSISNHLVNEVKKKKNQPTLTIQALQWRIPGNTVIRITNRKTDESLCGNWRMRQKGPANNLGEKKQSAESLIHKACCKVARRRSLKRENQKRVKRNGITEAIGRKPFSEVLNWFLFLLSKTS